MLTILLAHVVTENVVVVVYVVPWPSRVVVMRDTSGVVGTTGSSSDSAAVGRADEPTTGDISLD